ncbi:unnamed protein product [Cuscuta campestris]|uniref:Uncharacterized protein n=1 Tax=Cuscuta campestris TaxID=132261 RepID=A0A484N1H3_9ASTE|nr:unnamed protein product [Cuscuta campestris]
MTEEDLLQRLPSLLQQYGLFFSKGAPDFASMSQHTPSVAPHYGQRSSKASTDFVDIAGVTEVAACYLRISDPADYIVAHGSVFPRAPGDMRVVSTSALPTINVILDPEPMLYPEETELRMRPENIREFMQWEEVDQTIIIVFLRLLHDHMMEHDIASVGLLCPENMAYVVDYGDRQLDRIGLMFPEYPNKQGTLSVVTIPCDFVGSSSICVHNVLYRYPMYFSLLRLILKPN